MNEPLTDPQMAEELRWRRAEATLLRVEIERLNAKVVALRQRLQEKNEILHAYAGPAGMTPEDVAYALEEHVRVMRAVRALERSLQDYDIAGDDVLAEEHDLFIAAGVWPKAREIGWSEEESDD